MRITFQDDHNGHQSSLAFDFTSRVLLYLDSMCLFFKSFLFVKADPIPHLKIPVADKICYEIRHGSSLVNLLFSPELITFISGRGRKPSEPVILLTNGKEQGRHPSSLAPQQTLTNSFAASLETVARSYIRGTGLRSIPSLRYLGYSEKIQM
ncbi:hypothetical protein MJT46_007449 [Ovis ammon polii x Ovis aries]|nr:hypothetical protein MJT46_007449 [Ovis ammon polii x Ovis aries]